MAELNEGRVIGDLIKFEEDQRYSREIVTINASNTIIIGTPLMPVGDGLAKVTIGNEALVTAVALEAVTTDAESTAQIIAVVRHAIIIEDFLDVGTATLADVVAALTALGIVCRDDVPDTVPA